MLNVENTSKEFWVFTNDIMDSIHRTIAQRCTPGDLKAGVRTFLMDVGEWADLFGEPWPLAERNGGDPKQLYGLRMYQQSLMFRHMAGIPENVLIPHFFPQLEQSEQEKKNREARDFKWPIILTLNQGV